jgi:hypothetical protein
MSDSAGFPPFHINFPVVRHARLVVFPIPVEVDHDLPSRAEDGRDVRDTNHAQLRGRDRCKRIGPGRRRGRDPCHDRVWQTPGS